MLIIMIALVAKPFAQNSNVSNVSNKPMHHLRHVNYAHILDVQSQWAMYQRLHFYIWSIDFS